MHRGRTWTQRQLVGLGTPADYNAAPARAARARRDRGLADPVQLGLPRPTTWTRSSPSCSAPAASSSTTPTTWTRCLDGVDVGEISCAMNDPSPFTLLAFMLVAAERRGIDWNRITGTSNQSDYLSHYVANHMFYRLALPGARAC
jgi:methylmalonyl-CoA mutase N-terminal domain/subunit